MTQSLASLNVPGPIATAISQPFWDAATHGRLTIQHCSHCENWVFYPRERCPHCWSDALGWREASGRGRLKSFSEIWKPGHPGWIPATPYFVGLVELDEGPIMLSHVLAHRTIIDIGIRLDFVATKIGDRRLPCFRNAQTWETHNE